MLRVPLASAAAAADNASFVEIHEANLIEDTQQIIKMLTFEKVPI